MPLIGSVIKERFEVLKPLGDGGQGEVYVALDYETDEEVAIKFQFPQTFESTHLYKKFTASLARETKVGKSLSGVPGIPRTITGGSHQEKAFMVLELIKGPSLNTLISGHRPLVSPVAASIIGQLCGTLQVVHDRGLVHRDVKPENILQPFGDRVQLIDMGLAVPIGKAVKHAAGTRGYSPPEQFMRGAKLTPRADIFALGCLLLEMCVIQLPYLGREGRPWLAKEVLPREAMDDVPKVFLPLVLRMIALNPDDRPKSMREVLDCLRPALPAPGSARHSKTPEPDPTLFHRRVRPNGSN